MLIVKVLSIWLILLIFAILNGIFREKYLFLYFEQNIAFLLSGLLLLVFIFFTTYYSMRILRNANCFLVGLAWFILTIVFEFTFGVLFLEKSLYQMLEAYQLENGNIWSIILLFILISPCLAKKLKSP